jgi:hypothetical protein
MTMSGYERALSGYQWLPIDAVRVVVFIFEIWRTRCFRMFLLETALLLKHQIPHGHLHGSSLLLFLIAGIVLKDKTDIVAVFIPLFLATVKPPGHSARLHAKVHDEKSIRINFMHGPVQRRFDRRKIIFAVLQQRNLIVWNNLGHRRVAL